MSSLLRLKEWMTVDEAAEHLTSALDESVQEKDIYRLALDKHLGLSVDFVNHAQARVGTIVGPDEIEWDEMPKDLLPAIITEDDETTIKVMKSLCIGENQYVNFGKEVISINGIWDLMMLGGERLDIEHIYQNITGGPAVTLNNLGGTLVQRDGKVANVMESLDDNEFHLGSRAQESDMEANIAQKNVPYEKAEEMRRKFKQEKDAYLEKKNSRRKEDEPLLC